MTPGPIDAGDLRSGQNRLVRAVNAQQRRLVRVYDTWAAGVKRDMDAALKRWASPAQLKLILAGRLPELEAALLDTTHQGIQTAEKLVVGRATPTPRVLSVRGQHLLKNDMLVTSALVPFIGERLTAALTGAVIVDSRAVLGALVAQRSYPAQYAGGFWAMIFETKQAQGLDLDEEQKRLGLPPVKVRWVLDPSAEHCQASPGRYGCPEIAGEYPSWGALPTVPAGEVTCAVNCGCVVEVWRDGRWQR